MIQSADGVHKLIFNTEQRGSKLIYIDNSGRNAECLENAVLCDSTLENRMPQMSFGMVIYRSKLDREKR